MNSLIILINMKTPFLIILLFSSINFSVSQEELRLDGGCSFTNGSREEELFGYSASNEALNIVEEITAKMEIKNQFILKSANVANAKASSSGGQRYILYSTTFLEQFKKKSKTRWAACCVLAHEIGHHFNNDNFLETNEKRRKTAELSADRFAGFVLQRMGASLEEAQAGIESFSLKGETETHPPKSARLEAVANGWKQAQEGNAYTSDLSPPNENDQIAKDYFDKGMEYYHQKQFGEAINYFDLALKINPRFIVALLRRGDAYEKINKPRRAIADFDEVLYQDPKNTVALVYRGIVKSNLSLYESAILDFNLAIQLNKNYIGAYNARGVAFRNSKKWKESLEDFNYVISMEPENAPAYNNRATTYYDLEDYDFAINDLNTSIKLNPDNAKAFYNRASTLMKTNRNEEAILDFDKALEIDPNLTDAFNNRGSAKMNLGQFRQAISDFDSALKINSKDATLYNNLGNAYFRLDQLDKAIENYELAIFYDVNLAPAFGNLGCALIELKDPNRTKEAYDVLKTALQLDPELSSARQCLENLERK